MPGSSGPHFKRVVRVPVNELTIAKFFGDLLGCEIEVSSSEPGVAAAADGIVAAYTDEVGDLDALCLLDIGAAAGLAQAASIIDTSELRMALDRRRLSDVMLARLYGLCALAERLFIAGEQRRDQYRLTLREISQLPDLSADAQSLMSEYGARIDVRIALPGASGGHLALLTR